MFSSWFLPSLTVDMEVPMFPAVLLSFLSFGYGSNMIVPFKTNMEPEKSMLRIKPRNFYLVGGFKHEFYFPFHIRDVIRNPLT